MKNPSNQNHYSLSDDQRNAIRKCLRELVDAITVLDCAESITVHDKCYEDACQLYRDIMRAMEDGENILAAERIEIYFYPSRRHL